MLTPTLCTAGWFVETQITANNFKTFSSQKIVNSETNVVLSVLSEKPFFFVITFYRQMDARRGQSVDTATFRLNPTSGPIH